MFNSLISVIQGQLESLYGIEKAAVELSSTTKDFEGDVTLVVFPTCAQANKRHMSQQRRLVKLF